MCNVGMSQVRLHVCTPICIGVYVIIGSSGVYGVLRVSGLTRFYVTRHIYTML